MLGFLGVATTSELDYHYQYGFMIIVNVISGLICCLAASEESSLMRPLSAEDSKPIWDLFAVDTTKHAEFTMLLRSKVLYSSVTVMKAFIMFFASDTFRLSSKAKDEALTARVALAGEVPAAAAAALAMLALDRLQTADTEDQFCDTSAEAKQSRQIVRCTRVFITGGMWMAALWFGPSFVGWRVHVEFPEGGQAAADAWEPFMLLGTALWGLGQGIYLASDQALMLSLVPSQEESGRYLGLQSVCSFLGSTIGGVVSAGCLTFLGSNPVPNQSYGFQGYIGLFGAASIFSALISAVGLQINLFQRGRRLSPMSKDQLLHGQQEKTETTM